MTAKKTVKKAVKITALSKEMSVPTMIKSLETKLKSFSGINESNYLTSGSLEGIGDIRTITDLRTLIKAGASVEACEKGYTDYATKSMKLETFPQYQINGFSSEFWHKDIKLRYDLINQKETIDKLNYFKEKLEKFLSEEDQKDMLFAEMQQYLDK